MSKGVSGEQKIENIRNMRGMLNDYRKLHKRTPTNKEYSEALSMSQRTVSDYRRIIQEDDRLQLLELFENDRIIDAENLMKTINENVIVFKDIRDDESLAPGIRMDAAKNMEESLMDQIRIKRDAPEFMTGKYESNNGEEEEKEPVEIKEE